MNSSWGLGEKEEARWDRKELSEKHEKTPHPCQGVTGCARIVGREVGRRCFIITVKDESPEMEESAENRQSCTPAREELVRIYRFSARKDLGGSFGATPRFRRCGNPGPRRRAVRTPGRQGALSFTGPHCARSCVLPRAHLSPLTVQLGGRPLVPSPGRQAQRAGPGR